jgi:two-component sensor histidine kinase/Tfp pilus assembly protein PilF
MKKFFLIVAVLLLFSPAGFAQKIDPKTIDSLLALLKKAKDDSTKLNLYEAIINGHVNYKPQEGLGYQQAALELAKKLKSKSGTAMIKYRIGRIHWRMGNFDEALKNHFEVLDIYTQAGNKQNEGNVMVAIGQDYVDNGKYEEAMTYLSKALQISREVSDTITMAAACDVLSYLHELRGNIIEAAKVRYDYLKIIEPSGDKNALVHAIAQLAYNYQDLGNNADALKYFKQGLKPAKEAGDKIEEALLNASIGGLYTNSGDYREALNYYSTALRLAHEFNDIPVLADIHNGMGNLYQAMGKYADALEYYLIAAGELKSVTNKQNLANLYCEMGIVYTRLKKYDLAKQSLSDAKNLYEELNSKLPMDIYYRGMAILDSANADWKGAYQQYRKYIVARDSTFNKETLKKLVVSQMQYESDKKEAVIKAEQEKKDIVARAEISRQLNIRNLSFAVLALVLLFSLVVYRQRNKIAGEKKRSDLLLRDKELLLKEIHHRVKNNLEVVTSLLALQGAQIDDPNTKEAMQEGQNRVHSIGIVHQKLYQGTNLGAIEMKDYFINLSESILDSFGAEKRVTIECVMEQLDVDIDTAVPLGLIVNELLTNTLKYAFPGGQQGKVQIKLQKQNNGLLQLEVSDNGIGKSGITHGTGFGGQLVSLLTQQLGGSMREEVKDGTHIYFEFKPVKAA